MEICKICNKSFKNFLSLSSHIQIAHKMKSKDYYDLYLKKENEDICVNCGNKTKFISLRLGYRDHCCQKCSTTSEQTREKHRQVQTGKILTEEHKINISNSNMGKHRESPNQETRDKISKTLSGRCLPEDVKRKISKTWKNKIRNNYKNNRFKFGIPISNPQQKIFDIFKKYYNDVEINFQIDTFFVDIFIPQLNLCVEYDGMYWHKNKILQDIERIKKLKFLNYNFLVIRDYNKIKKFKKDFLINMIMNNKLNDTILII